MNCAVLGFQIFAKFAKVMREFGEMRARDFGLLILFSLFVFFFLSHTGISPSNPYDPPSLSPSVGDGFESYLWMEN